MSKTNFKIIKNTLSGKLHRIFRKTNPGGDIDKEAKKAVALQLLNNTINGSPQEPTIPPIKTGRLWASGSAFVGGDFVGDTSGRASDEPGTPNKKYSDKKGVVTVGFNTPYAARWHERQFHPGPYSRQAGNVGSKYLEKHLKADKEELLALYADKVKELLQKETK